MQSTRDASGLHSRLSGDVDLADLTPEERASWHLYGFIKVWPGCLSHIFHQVQLLFRECLVCSLDSQDMFMCSQVPFCTKAMSAETYATRSPSPIPVGRAFEDMLAQYYRSAEEIADKEFAEAQKARFEESPGRRRAELFGFGQKEWITFESL